MNRTTFIVKLLGATVLLTACATKQVSFSKLKPITSTDVPLKNTKVKGEALERWSHLDLLRDTIPGMSVDRAYEELLKFRKPTKVIVAVIDSGIDINHEDLKGRFWVNPKEIPGNGIDDDGNGYVDDIHGWNFLGDSNHENLEFTRIIKKGNGHPLFEKAKEVYEKEYAEAMGNKQQLDMILGFNQRMKDFLKKDDFTLEDVKAISTADPEINRLKMIMTQILSNASREEFNAQMQEYKDYVYSKLNYHLNLEFDGRTLVGDDPDNFEERGYGNGNVIGPDPKDAKHGTHVAGIIAQLRGNGLGGDGVVADNIEIMAIRAVPDGDEYDKDIALAIRYAVDNGAKVINGSFGKAFSPHAEWVWDAIAYAASKDVLIVHAAGNDAKNIDVEDNFPTNNRNGKMVSNAFLEIGALHHEFGSKIVAEFSNYGEHTVDIFSPGKEIYATVPLNKYEFQQGTSMASPNAAGVAALIRSYYPKLSAAQVRQIIMDSGVSIERDVIVGGDSKDRRPFKKLSRTGKIVNAYNAILMADKISK